MAIKKDGRYYEPLKIRDLQRMRTADLRRLIERAAGVLAERAPRGVPR